LDGQRRASAAADLSELDRPLASARGAAATAAQRAGSVSYILKGVTVQSPNWGRCCPPKPKWYRRSSRVRLHRITPFVGTGMLPRPTSPRCRITINGRYLPNSITIGRSIVSRWAIRPARISPFRRSREKSSWRRRIVSGHGIMPAALRIGFISPRCGRTQRRGVASSDGFRCLHRSERRWERASAFCESKCVDGGSPRLMPAFMPGIIGSASAACCSC